MEVGHSLGTVESVVIRGKTEYGDDFVICFDDAGKSALIDLEVERVITGFGTGKDEIVHTVTTGNKVSVEFECKNFNYILYPKSILTNDDAEMLLSF